jgi:hypothetical protein
MSVFLNFAIILNFEIGYQDDQRQWQRQAGKSSISKFSIPFSGHADKFVRRSSSTVLINLATVLASWPGAPAATWWLCAAKTKSFESWTGKFQFKFEFIDFVCLQIRKASA